MCGVVVGKEPEGRPARLTEDRGCILAHAEAHDGVVLAVNDGQRHFALGFPQLQVGVGAGLALKDHAGGDRKAPAIASGKFIKRL